MLDEKLIAKHMKALDISREEAIQLIESDKAIDKGEKLFELDESLQKGAKKARQVSRKKGDTTTAKKEKKAKPEKVEICSAMITGLQALQVENLEIVNAEREFTFKHNGTKYKVTLACPRS